MAPGELVEVRVSWPGHPRYLKKKKEIAYKRGDEGMREDDLLGNYK